MDHDRERDRLVAALRHKLTELDARVVAYRRERADEFRRYAVDLLTPVSDEAVVAAVAEAIEGKSDTNLASATGSKVAQTYPALYPGFLDNAGDEFGDHSRSILAAPPHSRTLPRRTASPPPVLYHTSGVPKEGPRRPPTNAPESSPSLHARDNDFRGVFTPPFLPLLDSWSNERRTSDPKPTSNSNDAGKSDATATTTSAATASTQTPEATSAQTDGAEATATKAEVSKAVEVKPTESISTATEPVVATAPPPAPEPKLKSALRRSSSYSSSRSSTRSSTPTFNSPANTSSPSSKRHVRFSFNGEEVLPTVSPPREHEDLSWLMHDDRMDHSVGHSSNIYDYSRHYHNATAGSGSFSTDYDSDSAHGNMGLGAAALSTPVSHSSLPDNEAEAGAARPSSASASALLAGDQQTTPPSSHGPGAQSETDNQLSALRNESQSNNDTSSHQSSSSSSSSSFQNTSSSSHHQTPPPPPQPRRRHSQILDDDEDEFVPLSRKVSSSDRLRALSKIPIEDPSMWTVVNPQADAAASAAAATSGDSTGNSAPTSDTDLAAITAANRGNLVYQPPVSQRPEAPSPPTVEQREYADGPSEDDSEDSSDDDDGFIAMRSTRKKTSTPAVAAPAEAAAKTPTASTTNGTAPEASSSNDVNSSRPKQSTPRNEPVKVTFAKTNGSNGKKPAAAAEDDDFFDFEPDNMNGDGEDGDVGYPLARVTDVNTHFDDDEDVAQEEPNEEDDEADDATVVDDKDLVKKEKSALGIGTDGLDSHDLVINRHKPITGREGEPAQSPSALSSSLSIARRSGQLLDDESNLPSSPGPASISAGSYRGKPIDLFNVVKDPRILEEAAQMGALNSFVGSIHDHETHAPANMAEFSSLSGREQLNLLSGTPRSLTERMIMDDTRAIFSPSKR